MAELYNSGQWFALRDAVQTIDKPDRILTGIVACVFNEPRRCERDMNRVLQSRPTLNEMLVALSRLTFCHLNTGRNRLALEHFQVEQQLWEQLRDRSAGGGLSGKSEDDLLPKLLRALARFPDQAVAARHPSTLRYDRNDGLIWTRAAVNGVTGSFALDTGAALSVVNESWAKRFGLQVLAIEPVEIPDFADKVRVTNLGLAERLEIGRIRLRNVPFLVASGFSGYRQPEAAGALGVPVLLACQSLRWNSDGILRLAENSRGRRNVSESNVALNELSMTVLVGYGSRQLDFTSDTGSPSTFLFTRFAETFPGLVKEAGSRKPWLLSGIGSERSVEATVLPELTLRVGGAQGTVRPAVIISGQAGEARYGLLGLDVLSQYHEVTLDFRTMKLTAE